MVPSLFPDLRTNNVSSRCSLLLSSLATLSLSHLQPLSHWCHSPDINSDRCLSLLLCSRAITLTVMTSLDIEFRVGDGCRGEQWL